MCLYDHLMSSSVQPSPSNRPLLLCPQGGKKFEYVYDNFAKNVDLAKPVASLAQDQKWPVKTYVFVSSGTRYFL
jgi:hypothetical protein